MHLECPCLLSKKERLKLHSLSGSVWELLKTWTYTAVPHFNITQQLFPSPACLFLSIDRLMRASQSKQAHQSRLNRGHPQDGEKEELCYCHNNYDRWPEPVRPLNHIMTAVEYNYISVMRYLKCDDSWCSLFTYNAVRQLLFQTVFFFLIWWNFKLNCINAFSLLNRIRSIYETLKIYSC